MSQEQTDHRRHHNDRRDHSCDDLFGMGLFRHDRNEFQRIMFRIPRDVFDGVGHLGCGIRGVADGRYTEQRNGGWRVHDAAQIRQRHGFGSVRSTATPAISVVGVAAVRTAVSPAPASDSSLPLAETTLLPVGNGSLTMGSDSGKLSGGISQRVSTISWEPLPICPRRAWSHAHRFPCILNSAYVYRLLAANLPGSKATSLYSAIPNTLGRNVVQSPADRREIEQRPVSAFCPCGTITC